MVDIVVGVGFVRYVGVLGERGCVVFDGSGCDELFGFVVYGGVGGLVFDVIGC